MYALYVKRLLTYIMAGVILTFCSPVPSSNSCHKQCVHKSMISSNFQYIWIPLLLLLSLLFLQLLTRGNNDNNCTKTQYAYQLVKKERIYAVYILYFMHLRTAFLIENLLYLSLEVCLKHRFLYARKKEKQ